jgi:site-specific recombinase XerD
MAKYAATELALEVTPQDFRGYLKSFTRHLQAGNKAARTIQTYTESLTRLAAYLEAEGMPTDPTMVTREHVESFIADLLGRYKPATAHNRYRALATFFRWLVEEGEIRTSPMDRMRAPAIPENPPAVLSEAQLTRLLKACEGKGFDERRDTAFIRLFIDTGMRRAELAGLKVTDIDLDQNIAIVMGKGSRPRVCAFGNKTSVAIDRYLRLRAKHRNADSLQLWLGHAGPMTDNGLYQTLQRRAEQAGLGKVYPHQLRHSFAHHWLAEGGNESDLMRLDGWKARNMVDRYGASAAAERARLAHKRLGLGDRL